MPPTHAFVSRILILDCGSQFTQLIARRVREARVCCEMQWITLAEGGRVVAAGGREYGRAEVQVVEPQGMFAGFAPGEKTTVWMSHGDHVEEAPPGYVVTARSDRVI